MSFEEKSMWLRQVQNPVMIAAHAALYPLNTQVFLKSSARPIGDLVDYSIRIEYKCISVVSNIVMVTSVKKKLLHKIKW